jgi:hypothetical protein
VTGAGRTLTRGGDGPAAVEATTGRRTGGAGLLWAIVGRPGTLLVGAVTSRAVSLLVLGAVSRCSCSADDSACRSERNKTEIPVKNQNTTDARPNLPDPVTLHSVSCSSHDDVAGPIKCKVVPIHIMLVAMLAATTCRTCFG